MASRLAALLLAAALVAPPLSGHQAAPPAAGRPALLVLIVVDQFRYEYVTRFHALWTGGFRRLLDTGAVFDEARYPYLNTVTCAGHATIATGAFPATHGIVLNEWWDDASQKRVPCTGDPAVESLPYGGRPESIGHSAHHLQVPTFGDRLRRHSPSSRVVSLSIKPRSAVMMAGHGGTATWFASTDTWATSTAFMPAPAPIVAAYVKAHSVEDDRRTVWQRAKAPEFYTGDDASAVEWPRTGWTTTFPHPLSGAPGTPARGFFALWERSPFSDAYLGRMAAQMARDFALGSRNATDLLAVSFSAVDYVGHDFGPDSHEAQDTVVRLDAVLGDLLDALDRHVGKDRYVVALSADHGVGPIPELRQQAGLDAGRVLAKDVRTVAEKVLAVLGPGPHVADVQYTDVYLTDAARTALAGRPETMRALLEALGAMPGVMRVMPADELRGARTSDDPVRRAAALSHWPGRSGDIIMVPKPYWITTSTSAATHGTLHPYDQHVPLILMGRAFKPGHYADAVSPADIAPTFAALAGVPISGVDGKALAMAWQGSEQVRK